MNLDRVWPRSPHGLRRRNHRLLGGWGSTIDEQTRKLAGDELVPKPMAETTHAISIDGDAQSVWPWLVQMGYGRGGWYTPPFVDRLWRVHNPSANTIMPEYQTLEPGAIILDGPPGTATFEVMDLEIEDYLVLYSRRHPITGTPPQPGSSTRQTYIEFSWVFALTSASTGSTRLLLRTRSRIYPFWLRLVAKLFLLPADLVMGRWMLKGIAARVVGDASLRPRTAR